MDWLLPPQIPWPQFLKLLRHTRPPQAWLEAASEIPDVRKKPMLLRWIAQHRNAPTHLRVSLIARLPWRALASIAWDPIAHPQARTLSIERLQLLWVSLTTGERRSFATMAPRQMWPMVWKVRDSGVLSAFLKHSKLSLEMVISLIQPPIYPTHLEALQASHLSTIAPIAKQVISAIDRSLQLPDHGLSHSSAIPWIRNLATEDFRQVFSELNNPLLKRMIERMVSSDGKNYFYSPKDI
ncbi:MAG: hypothetical protein FWG12_03535 [Holophagaceae bacterium]|nr:hypothetical protein [Holophagaceae bacterium]